MTDKPSLPNGLISALIREPDQNLDKLARSVIAAAIEVHRHLGPGLSEPLYAPAIQLNYHTQHSFRIRGNSAGRL